MHENRSKVTNDEPSFEVTHFGGAGGDGGGGGGGAGGGGAGGGDGGGTVKIFVFAQNRKGSSEAFIIEESLRHLRQSKHAVEGERRRNCGNVLPATLTGTYTYSRCKSSER